MDPNANLKEQREIIARMIEITDQQDDPPTDDQYLAEYIELAGRLCDLAQALDEWITRGGFLPQAWSTGR